MLLKIFVSLAAVSAALAYVPSTALACSCVAFTKPDYARQATLVFTGTVTSIDIYGGFLLLSTADPVKVVFDVDTVYKGDVRKTMAVSTVRNGASCGYEFTLGHRYTVFPLLRDGALKADLCLGNVEGPIDPQSYLLGSGYRPADDPPQTARLLIVAGTVLATLAFIAVERRRVRRSPRASAT
jgi:hypothetical protein